MSALPIAVVGDPRRASQRPDENTSLTAPWIIAAIKPASVQSPRLVAFSLSYFTTLRYPKNCKPPTTADITHASSKLPNMSQGTKSL